MLGREITQALEVQSVNSTQGRRYLLGKEHESEPFDTSSSVSENVLALMHGGLLSVRITRIQETASTENRWTVT
jgi:hypothetical protein